MDEFSDANVAEYLGCTAEQVRILRLHKLTCPDCVNVHVAFPSIRAFHSPLCAANRKCASCGKEMPELTRGHEVGLICWDCYGSEEG